MEQDHQNQLIYHGKHLYNPNDYLDDDNKSTYTQNSETCEMPQHFSSTLLLIPPKKKRSVPPKQQEEDKNNNNDNNVDKNSSEHDVSLSNDKKLLLFCSGTSSNTSRRRLQGENAGKSYLSRYISSTIYPKDIITSNSFTSSHETAAIFSASGTQMLSDNDSRVEFPEPDDFKLYMSANKESTREKTLQLEVKTGRRLLCPNYKLNKLHSTFRSGFSLVKIPVFLTESAYNSSLELRLAEIDEIMRGHPPSKKMKLDLFDFIKESLSINDKNNDPTSGDVQSLIVLQEKLSLKFIHNPRISEKLDPRDENQKNDSSSDTENEMHPAHEEGTNATNYFKCDANHSQVRGDNAQLKCLSDDNIRKTKSTQLESNKIDLEEELPSSKLTTPTTKKSGLLKLQSNSSICATVGISISKIFQKKLRSNSSSDVKYNLSEEKLPSHGSQTVVVEMGDHYYEVVEEERVEYHDSETLERMSERHVSKLVDCSGESTIETFAAQKCPSSPNLSIFGINSEKSSNSILYFKEQKKSGQILVENQEGEVIIREDNLSKEKADSSVVRKHETIQGEEFNEIPEVTGNEARQHQKLNQVVNMGNIQAKFPDYSSSENGNLAEYNPNHANKVDDPPVSIKDNNCQTSAVQIVHEKKKLSIFKSILGVFLKGSSKTVVERESCLPSPAFSSGNTARRTFFQKLFRISSSAKSPTSIELKDVSGGNLDAGRNDMNGNLIISERKDQNHIGPKHVDSVSLMRRKRLQLFAETQQFYQDSIMAYKCSTGATSPVMTSIPPIRFPSELVRIAANQKTFALGPRRVLADPDRFLRFGHKSTVSESIILPAISGKKRRLNQSLLFDAADVKPSVSKTTEKQDGSVNQLKGILKKI